MALPDAALGAVVAATIAGVVSLLGLTISKESKISEFRQAWIDALRIDLAALVSSVHSLTSAVEAMEQGLSGNFTVLPLDPLKDWKAIREDWNDANRTITAIRLRLNPAESSDLLAALARLEAEMQPGNQTSRAALSKLLMQLVGESQILLKQEWTVVKKGEPVYRLTKGLTIAIVLVGLFASSVLVLYQPG